MQRLQPEEVKVVEKTAELVREFQVTHKLSASAAVQLAAALMSGALAR